MPPVIAFCTTCKDRQQHLMQTLPRNLSDNEDYRGFAMFIIVDYGSIEPVRVPRYSWVHLQRYETDRFRMAHAKNMAHRIGIECGADILVNMDADNYTGPHFARYLAKMFELHQDIFMVSRMVQQCGEWIGGTRCLLPRDHEVDHTTDREVLEWLYHENERPLVRGISGRIAVTKEAFIKTGGYDESRYNDWGPDDKDFNFRLQRLGYRPLAIANRFLGAIHHSEKLRFREYPHARADDSIENEDVVPEMDTTVVNFGDIGCGGAIKPIPTRIFGIGFHKTGTTSLYEAFKILGYDAAHWTNARWARTIWEEMEATGKSITLEKAYALTDFPIGLLWRELDKAYPGSKFILTVRDVADWLDSVEKHFSDANPWRSSWDGDCFTHKLHTLVYGRKKFDRQVMLDRYWRHNAEVLDYFKGRNDLLVMPRPEWTPLCTFLGKDVPNVPYPKANLTPSQTRVELDK
jgi:hypothetical protein